MAEGMKKLLNIVAKLEVGKNHRNDFGKYSFRNAEDILAALKPLMVEYGVYVAITDGIDLVHERYYVKATVTAYDTETGDEILSCDGYAREPLSRKGLDEAQVTGASSSYARKYADEMPPDPEQKKTSNTNCTIEQYVNIISQQGIDPQDFTEHLFHKEIAALDQKQINNTVMRFQDALKVYYSIIDGEQAKK